MLWRAPSDIVAGGQVFCANEGNEGELGHSVGRLGEDIWVFSTGYPHPSAKWPHDVGYIGDRTNISKAATIKLLGGNAARFLLSLANVLV